MEEDTPLPSPHDPLTRSGISMGAGRPQHLDPSTHHSTSQPWPAEASGTANLSTISENPYLWERALGVSWTRSFLPLCSEHQPRSTVCRPLNHLSGPRLRLTLGSLLSDNSPFVLPGEFLISPVEGVLRVRKDVELDRENIAFYNLTICARDRGEPPLSSTVSPT